MRINNTGAGNKVRLNSSAGENKKKMSSKALKDKNPEKLVGLHADLVEIRNATKVTPEKPAPGRDMRNMMSGKCGDKRCYCFCPCKGCKLCNCHG